MKDFLNFAGIVVVFVLLSLSCSKKEELDTSKDFASDTIVSNDKTAGHVWKWINNLDDEEEPACIAGLSNCLEYCCVTPKVVEDFIDAIDANEERTFLSDSNILSELGQGFVYYEQLLEDVRDGNKYVIYYYSMGYDRVMFLYGGSDVSKSRFDGAQAFGL